MERSTVPVKVIRYKNESLLSRVQARSLISLFRESEKIVLDFNEVDFIGQPFADEVFRVFANEHPHIKLEVIDTNKEIDKIINLVRVDNLPH
jgi:hypothetical protein